MAQNNIDHEQIRNLLVKLKLKMAIIRENYEKALSLYGEDHPFTIAARKELDDLLLELKNIIFWLDPM